jgi:Domain of unknown function (DUF4386)
MKAILPRQCEQRLTTEQNMNLKQKARLAGVLYLLMGVAASVTFSTIPTWTMKGTNAAAMASKLAMSPLSYRIGVLSEVAAEVLSVFAVLVLYELFEVVNKRYAVLMLMLSIVSVPMGFANLLVGMAPLVLLSGAEYLSVFDKNQLDALALGFLELRGYGIRVQMALFGLVLVPFGLLVFRSGFIPRIVGILLILSCFPYLVASVGSFLFPAYANTLSRAPALAIGEFAIILWLLIKGARTGPSQASVRA